MAIDHLTAFPAREKPRGRPARLGRLMTAQTVEPELLAEIPASAPGRVVGLASGGSRTDVPLSGARKPKKAHYLTAGL